MTGPGAERDAPAPLRNVMIVGGGCYGTFYTGQLLTARRRGGLVTESIRVVDRDPGCRAARALPGESAWSLVVRGWAEYLREFLAAPEPAPGRPDDAVVPSPLMPHLFADWLAGAARARWPGRTVTLGAPDRAFGTPYDTVGPDRVRYVSFADWICPTHCVEPLTCPMIRGPRTWEMGDAFREYARQLGRERPTAGPALFTTRHYAYGVGMIHAAEIRRSRALLEAAGASGRPAELLVGTVSACHGAASLLGLGAG